MLPQPNRLPSYTIRDVMRRGRRIIGNGLTLILVSRLDDGTHFSRFACIVSTKVDKRSVVRNRMKRVLSESIYHLLPSIISSVDCVIVGSKELVGLTQVEVQLRTSDVFRNAHVLNNES